MPQRDGPRAGSLESRVRRRQMRPSGWVLVACALAAAAAVAQDRAALQEARDRARAAHDARDFAGFRTWSEKVVALAPRSTRALYNLACARALAGDAPGAVDLLQRLTRMEVATNAARDTDFDPIRATPE